MLQLVLEPFRRSFSNPTTSMRSIGNGSDLATLQLKATSSARAIPRPTIVPSTITLQPRSRHFTPTPSTGRKNLSFGRLMVPLFALCLMLILSLLAARTTPKLLCVSRWATGWDVLPLLPKQTLLLWVRANGPEVPLISARVHSPCTFPQSPLRTTDLDASTPTQT